MALGTVEREITIPGLSLREVVIEVAGDSPLIVHAWSKKAKEQILAKQTKKAQPKKEAKNPLRDFVESLHLVTGTEPHINYDNEDLTEREVMNALKDSVHGFPVIAFKAAAATAWDQVEGLKKKQILASFHINSEQRNRDGDDLCVLTYDELRMREDMVRIAGSTADIRFRGEYIGWATKLKCVYNSSVISLEQLIHVINTSGFGVGVGEWRPQKNGQNGRYHVLGTSEPENI